jgi:hypothetical protein
MKVYRTEIHGHLLEARNSEWGSETVLVDGRQVSSKPLAGIWKSSHHFDLQDEDGRTRHVEVHWLDVSKLGLGKYRVVINVDGVERCRLDAIDLSVPPSTCPHCGYSLNGLPVVNSEVRCPVCGRHSSAILIGGSHDRHQP